ncbi:MULTISPECIES: SpoIIE family protein phosphatase [Actinomycetes]|uniref:SpoIIE family protein phosphatase n=1 Tax=Actinomycetes TaxID=1760 RepID=UPI0001B5600B|nr:MULTISPECIES: SpoIIE family protein phosphatase [Actinomycetes]EFL06794.1 predicted protein [Streptomyces sp. AA4]
MPHRFQALDGDRFVFVSDGVYNATGLLGELCGDRELSEAVVTTADLPAAHVPGMVLRELATRRDHAQAEDDAMVVCLGWFGPTPLPGAGASTIAVARTAP